MRDDSGQVTSAIELGLTYTHSKLYDKGSICQNSYSRGSAFSILSRGRPSSLGSALGVPRLAQGSGVLLRPVAASRY
jgi:hypothetical protein